MSLRDGKTSSDSEENVSPQAIESASKEAENMEMGKSPTISLADEMTKALQNALSTLLASLEEQEDKIRYQSKGTQGNHKTVGEDHASGLGQRGYSYKTFSSTQLEKFSVAVHSSYRLVQFAVTTFTSTTLQWWNTEKTVKGIVEVAKMFWDSLKELMIKEYCSRVDVVRLETKYLNLVQDSDTEYNNKFTEKARFATTSGCDRIKERLRVDIKRYVEVIMPKTFLQTVVVAKIVEKSSDRLIEAGNGVRRKWEDNCKRFKKLMVNYPLSSSCNKSHFGECKIGSTWCFKFGKLGQNQRMSKKSLVVEIADGSQREIDETVKVCTNIISEKEFPDKLISKRLKQNRYCPMNGLVV
ncbi:LOW QUALITY PROTEIN: hypothetical protein OSB04_006116 [Centaurea solstitialis]|uniref:Retrotransposon gag domain-containing protein n=1 Tax=Centaurea solstitialis TaxID=347529 RepID=A0AA38TV49_9ASTR|nr:LOW QUALITY PROTEIN: hypothetical protein OSB04_006116 [Centaurea solstitialis]